MLTHNRRLRVDELLAVLQRVAFDFLHAFRLAALVRLIVRLHQHKGHKLTFCVDDAAMSFTFHLNHLLLVFRGW